MKAIIFGVNGQDGYYLKLLLEAKGIDVTGVSRSEGNWLKGNVSDYHFVEQLIKNQMPDYIYHLAAKSTTRHEALFENHETISTGSLNILESVYKFCPACKVFLSGSAMQFRNEGKPINEHTPFEALNSYAIARIQSTYAARYYRSKGVKAYIGYFFNHESPLRGPAHVSRMITDAVKRIQSGSPEKIELGNISVKKEWNFAGDFAEAMFILMSQEKVYEAIIGSGETHSIAEWAKICFDMINKDWQDFVVQKTGFVPEYETLVSDPALLFSLGYSPKVNIVKLAELMMK